MRLFSVLLFFVSLSAFAAPPVPSGNIVSLTVGGRVFTDLTNLKTLTAMVASTNNSSLRAPNGTAGYAVTAGKTLDIVAAKCNVFTSGTATYQIGYTDNDLGMNSATAKTNGVYFAGSALVGFFNNAAVGMQEFPIQKFSVPATKIPFIESNSAGGVVCIFFGYER